MLLSQREQSRKDLHVFLRIYLFIKVIKNDRKKLDMDSADPQNRSEWRGHLRGRLVKKPNPR